MRRFGLLIAVGAFILAFASQATAATTAVPLRATFSEPIVPGVKSGCPVSPEGFCGSGEVSPFGHASETIMFGGACGGNCDLRTISLAGGSIYLDESFGNGTCPGVCRPNRAEPDAGTLNDVVAGGTGVFASASGNLSGSVSAAGQESVIKLSGTITLTS